MQRNQMNQGMNPNPNVNFHPNPNPNLYRNPLVDPLFACRATARTWNLVALSFKMIGAVSLFICSLYLLVLAYTYDNNGYSASGRENRNAELPIYDLKPIFTGLLVVSILLLISYVVSLYGVIKEILGLVVFWVVLMVLEFGGNIALIIYAIQLGTLGVLPQRTFVAFIAPIPLNIFYFNCGIALLKRVRAKTPVSGHPYRQI